MSPSPSDHRTHEDEFVQIKGIFSKMSEQDCIPGQANTQSKLWFGKSIDADTVMLQELDANQTPTGTQIVKKRNDFFREFVLEPELGYKFLTQRVAQGDFYRKQQMHAEAQIEYQHVLKIDVENIRAMFGLGLVYLSMNQTGKGKYIFKRLVALDESFEEQHKHLFNEFGIGLRKKGLYNEALEYYSRAFALSPDDEHLCLNMARASFEKGAFDDAFLHLKKSCELNPHFEQAKMFVSYLKKAGHAPTDPELANFFGIRPRKRRTRQRTSRMD